MNQKGPKISLQSLSLSFIRPTRINTEIQNNKKNRVIKIERESIKKTLEDTLGINNIQLERQEYYISLHNFFKQNFQIYDSCSYWYEDIQFPDEAIQARMIQLSFEGAEDDKDFQARSSLLDDLAYWTIYYQPGIESIETALKSGLTPFYYRNNFYLALGGCGMDLPPKLDVYQMLTSGTIPSDSQVLKPKGKDYFEYVVGKELTRKALENCLRLEPRIIISYNEPRKNTFSL